MGWSLGKLITRFKTDDDQDIVGFETYVIAVLKKSLEWEYHDEEEQERYIAYYDPKINSDRITKMYLIPFKENIELMWNL